MYLIFIQNQSNSRVFLRKQQVGVKLRETLRLLMEQELDTLSMTDVYIKWRETRICFHVRSFYRTLGKRFVEVFYTQTGLKNIGRSREKRGVRSTIDTDTYDPHQVVRKVVFGRRKLQELQSFGTTRTRS